VQHGKKDNHQYDVIIVGAGAAGILAAGRAAHQGLKVLLVEKMNRAARKLLITGKGRCNITHDAGQDVYFKNIFPNPRFLKHAFHAFFVQDILNIMHDHGVETTTERGSRVFPVSNSAAEVVNALLQWMGTRNITLRYGMRVNNLLLEEDTITGVSATGENGTNEYHAPNVIICTGGRSYPATGSTGDGYTLAKQVGHNISNVFPALVPLVTQGDIAPRLQGLGLKNVNAVVWVNGRKFGEEFGEVMFAHYGLTGPVILTLSRVIVEQMELNNKVEVSIDLKPALDEQKLDNRLLRDINEHGKKHVGNIFRQWLPAKMIPVFLEILGLDENKLCNQLGAKERKKIILLMKDFRFTITGHPGFKEAIITAGGVSTSEIQSKTMESKLIKGLYFAGEVIDLDANTGGFNLQIAWSTAWLAAGSIIEKSKHKE
jgi:predicted Rossmann fold flavoprotein